MLSDNEVAGLLMQRFQLASKVDQIPDAVRESFDNFVDWPWVEQWAAQEGMKVETVAPPAPAER